jgi:hypothetical protein
MYEATIRFDTLEGKVLTEIRNYDNEKLVFTTDDGTRYKLYHRQDCCERVTIEDINGNLDDLLGMPILLAEEVSNESPDIDEYQDFTFTWSFYKLATARGHVTIRWYGESNGYYSERVDFVELET